MVAHTIQVRVASRLLLVSLQDAEIAQRGYLLTRDARHLGPFRRAVELVPFQLKKLLELTTDNPVQQSRLHALQPLLKSRFDELWQTIHLERQGLHAEALSIVVNARGERAMNDIRLRLATILGMETDLLDQRRTTSTDLRLLLVLFAAISLAAAVTLTALLSRATRDSLGRLQTRTRELEGEIARRQQAESSLHQAQKMEVVGQLTGGIAHDFNNLLTIIMGNLDSLKRRLAKRNLTDQELSKPLDAAQQGARSAAQLTHRLLAFSRRQMLAPACLDLNRLVQDMSEMIRRTLGEAVDIETVLAGGLWRTFADPNQLENALLNLSINARDAMPNGGKLMIETANASLDESYAARFGDLAPGQYVLLCVTDTGTGIAPELMEKVFEPFFTTKSDGTGSGLGLAMVYGFVRQSGGHVRIYSEVGQGTTIKLYLPRFSGKDEISAPRDLESEPSPFDAGARESGTILLVEDNVSVREYAATALVELGYTVLAANDAREAMKIVDSGAKIDLLFTDVVLPGGISGRDLAGQVSEKRPGLPVLFTTGYTRNAIVHGGRLDADVQLLNKPYTLHDLARKVREQLGSAAVAAR
jgi:signal transduction histidine kinase/CheY-like chemotaxis protein